MITILLVDDHATFLSSLRSLLGAQEDMDVLATAPNGMDAVTAARQQCFDIAVMDISMPLMDGIEATRQIHQVCRVTRVLMLSGYDSPAYVERALAVGAAGYVLKDEIGVDLLVAVRTLALGKRYFSHKVAKIAKQYLGWKRSDTRAG
jgi:DNA-binding NarL/FixJ family response regulator